MKAKCIFPIGEFQWFHVSNYVGIKYNPKKFEETPDKKTAGIENTEIKSMKCKKNTKFSRNN